MTSAPLPTELAPEVTSHHQDVLNDVVDIGHEFARMALNQAKTGTLPLVKATNAYDRLTCSIRRSIWLVRKLAEPIKTVDRVAARKRIIRVVEDTIQRHAEDEAAEILREEFLDRLDAPDLEDEIGCRPVEDVITDLVRDLGLASVPGNHPWMRRTPEDVAMLCARAARPALAAGEMATTPPGRSQTPPHASDRNPIQLS